MMRRRFVKVTWVDASSCHGDVYPNDSYHSDPSYILDTVGEVIKDDKKWIMLAGDRVVRDNKWRNVTAIPKKYVKKIRELR